MKTNFELFKNGDELRQRWQKSFSGEHGYGTR